MGYVGTKPADAALTTSDLGDSIVTAAKLASDAVETAKVKDLNVTVAKLPAAVDISTKTVTLPATVAGLGTGINVASQITGTVPAANLGSGTASSTTYLAGDQTYKALSSYDDNVVQSNIAVLGFKIAANGALAKYNLVDQIIDEYEDASGVDAGASINETLNDGAYFGGTLSYPTGGDVTTPISGYRQHAFLTDASLVVSVTGSVDIMVVAGGASGGSDMAGGGGAGGLVYKASHELTSNTYDAVIGDGGAASGMASLGNDGDDSTWTINGGATEFTAVGGGGGSSEQPGTNSGRDGGSGGGGSGGTNDQGAGSSTQSAQSGDSGTYGFGFDGGVGTGPPNYNSGGGGGAGSVGQAADATGANISGNGGTGKDYSAIFGTVVGDGGWFASGGGGAYGSNGPSGGGTASAGGGTDGAQVAEGGSDPAQANTGGASGGASDNPASNEAGAGGSGVVIVRYTTATFKTFADMTLQSTDTTASTANPDYADMVVLMEDGAGTATLNTDIKGYISEDSGVTFTQGTLVDEGTWGTNKKIIAFHDLDISAQTGSAMCYKITTHNQSASKSTNIHATSIGWR